MTLTNLDLQQLDPATGAVQAQSNSTIDNVEQVRSPGRRRDGDLQGQGDLVRSTASRLSRSRSRRRGR